MAVAVDSEVVAVDVVADFYACGGVGRFRYDNIKWDLIERGEIMHCTIKRLVKCHMGERVISITFEGIDFQDVEESAPIKRLLNELSINANCYVEVHEIDPDNELKNVTHFQPPSKQKGHYRSGHMKYLQIEPFDAFLLNPDIDEWLHLAICFSDPSYGWEDYLNSPPIRLSYQIMDIDAVNAWFGTGNSDGQYIMVKTTHKHLVDKFLAEMQGIGFSICTNLTQRPF